MVRRLAVLSLHTSPLAQPGAGDSGGMNVYVRELVSALAQAGVTSDVYTRRWAEGPARRRRGRAGVPGRARARRARRPAQGGASPRSSTSSPRACSTACRHGRSTGPMASTRSTPTTGCRAWPATASSTSWTCRWCRRSTRWPGSRPRRATPSRSAGSTPRPRSIGCSDAILANCPAEAAQLERLYGADPARIEIVAARGRSTPSSRPATGPGARAALPQLGPGDGPVLLFVGRIQPLKGLDVAVRALAELDDPTAVLVVVGGASGRGRPPRGRAHREAGGRRWAWPTACGSPTPQPHHMLSTYYRAADVVLVPSRSESFGLVALEAAACGTPVVAAAVGGLRTLVDHGRTGFLVEGRDPAVFAAYTEQILTNPAARPRAGGARRRPGPATSRGRPPPPACAASTPTSPPARPSPARLSLAARGAPVASAP